MKTEGVRILQKQSVKVAEFDSQDSSSLHNKVPSEAASVDAEAEASYPKDMVKKTDFNVVKQHCIRVHQEFYGKMELKDNIIVLQNCFEDHTKVFHNIHCSMNILKINYVAKHLGLL